MIGCFIVQGDDGRLPHVHPRQPGEEAGQARGQGKGPVVHQLYNIMILKIQQIRPIWV